MSIEEWFLSRLLLFVPLVLSLSVHEWAHAWAAWRLGDDTAARLGRLTLDPLAHIDPVGTVLLPLAGVPFGWAKPVPINPTRFRRGVRMGTGLMIAAAAGPLSNLVLAALAGLGLWAVSGGGGPGALEPLAYLLRVLLLLNLALAFFNLLPIPPLDGSRIVEAFVPDRVRPAWNRLEGFGPLLLVVVFVLLALVGPRLFGFGGDASRILF